MMLNRSDPRASLGEAVYSLLLSVLNQVREAWVPQMSHILP